MNQRIRYSKLNEDGSLLQSVKVYSHTTNGGRFKILLNLNDKHWSVIDDTCDVVAVSGHAVSLHKMKTAAKKALTELGIVFSNEDRNGKVKKTLALSATTS